MNAIPVSFPLPSEDRDHLAVIREFRAWVREQRGEIEIGQFQPNTTVNGDGKEAMLQRTR